MVNDLSAHFLESEFIHLVNDYPFQIALVGATIAFKLIKLLRQVAPDDVKFRPMAGIMVLAIGLLIGKSLIDFLTNLNVGKNPFADRNASIIVPIIGTEIVAIGEMAWLIPILAFLKKAGFIMPKPEH